MPVDFDFSVFSGLTDSKKLTHKERERLFMLIEKSLSQKIRRGVGIQSAETIDRVGIREANRLAMQDALGQIFSSLPIDDVKEVQIDGRDNYRFDSISSQMIRYIVR